MFDFRAFLINGLVDGVRGGQTRYALTMRAASLVEKGLLDTADLEPLAKALDERESAKQDVDNGEREPDTASDKMTE